jgi:hypothetical protein
MSDFAKIRSELHDTRFWNVLCPMIHPTPLIRNGDLSRVVGP